MLLKFSLISLDAEFPRLRTESINFRLSAICCSRNFVRQLLAGKSNPSSRPTDPYLAGANEIEGSTEFCLLELIGLLYGFGLSPFTEITGGVGAGGFLGNVVSFDLEKLETELKIIETCQRIE